MPSPRKRTRSRKRIQKSLPGGVNKVHYKNENTNPKRCRVCKQPLAGFPHASRSKASKLNRAKRRVWRLYGGEICASCLKSGLRQAAKTLNT